MDLNMGWWARDFFVCAYPRVGVAHWDGLVVPRTERHERLFEVQVMTRTPGEDTYTPGEDTYTPGEDTYAR